MAWTNVAKTVIVVTLLVLGTDPTPLLIQAAVTAGVFQRGVGGNQDATYSGVLEYSKSVNGIKRCSALARKLKKIAYQFTRPGDSGAGTCELFADESPLKRQLLRVTTNRIAPGNPVLYVATSAVGRFDAEYFRRFAVNDYLSTPGCNPTRTASPYPSNGYGTILIGMRSNTAGNPRTLSDVKCLDFTYGLSLSVAATSTIDTSAATWTCPANEVVAGLYNWSPTGIPLSFRCFSVTTTGAVLNATDCYDIISVGTDIIVDLGGTKGTDELWGLECKSWPLLYVMVGLKKESASPYNIDRIKCCRLIF